MAKSSLKKFFCLISLFSLLLNLISPILLNPLYAEELSSSVFQEENTAPIEALNPTLSPVIDPTLSSSPDSSPVPSPTIFIKPSPSTEPTPTLELAISPLVLEATPTPSIVFQNDSSSTQIWTRQNDGSYQTSENLIVDNEYIFPGNDKVRIKFTKLPNPSGKLTIQSIQLTPEQIESTKAISNTAYDITSNMTNGTFEYALTLPTSRTENVEVKSSEDSNVFVTLGNVSAGTDTLTVKNLDHFTIFVVAGNIDVSATPLGIPFDESASQVVINEFVYNPASGNEWIELYNKSSNAINLSGWKLEDNNGISDDINLSGAISAYGILVFEHSAGWLNNTSANGQGDRIYLKNNGTIIDEVEYVRSGVGVIANTKAVTVSGENNTLPGKSIGRLIDGSGDINTWQKFSTPTKGWPNNSWCLDSTCSSIDSSAPLTTDNIDGNWHNGDVVVSLSCLDSGSGCVNTYFTTDGFTPTTSSSSGASITLSSDGIYTIKYFSVDSAGNQEVVRAAANQVKIDKTSPSGLVINSSSHNTSTWSNLNIVNLNWSSATDSGSGIAGYFSEWNNFSTSVSGSLYKKYDTSVSAELSPALSDGINNYFHLFAKDFANNWSSIFNSGPYWIDTIAPSTPKATPDSGYYSSTQNITLISTGSSVIRYSTTQVLSNCSAGNLYTSLISISSSATMFAIGCDSAGNVSRASIFSYTIGSDSLQPPSGNIGQVYTGSLITLNNNASLNLSNGTQVSPIIYTGGDLTNQNLTNPITVGDQSVIIGKEVKIVSDTNISLLNVDLSNVSIIIPNNTTVLAPSGWDGKISPPKTTTNSGNAPSGYSVGNNIIEIGSSLGTLFFDQPVVITLSNVAGDVGYKPAGSSNWTKIANQCTGTYLNPGKPTFPGECYISDGTNIKIYTYHFTTFAKLNTISSTSSSDSSSGGSSSGSSGGGGSASAPVCNDAKPASAPTLLSAETSGANEVILTWSKAQDPVSYYLVAYGLSSGSLEYGNPNIGGSDISSYTVRGLSGGKTYYFRVRAGNGCRPGGYSNELSVAIKGPALSTLPQDFNKGVLGVQNNEQKNISIKERVMAENKSNKQADKNILENLSNQSKSLTKAFILTTLLLTLFYWWKNRSFLR